MTSSLAFLGASGQKVDAGEDIEVTANEDMDVEMVVGGFAAGLVGIGASVLPGCSIGVWAKVGAGAAVIRDIPAHSISVGVPAKETGRRNGCKD